MHGGLRLGGFAEVVVREGRIARPPTWVWAAAAYVAIYGLLQPLTGLFSTVGGTSVWFPPAAITLTWLFVAPPTVGLAVAIGTRIFWAIALGSGTDLLITVGSAILITSSYLVAVLLFRRLVAGPVDVSRPGPGPVTGFVLLGAVVGPALAAVTSRTFVTVVRGSDWDMWGDAVRSFWIGDAVAIMTLVPLFWAAVVLRRDPPRPRVRGELVLATLGSALIAWAVVQVPATPLYLVMVPAIAAALRHGLIGASVAVAGAGMTTTIELTTTNNSIASVGAAHAFLIVLATVAGAVGVAEQTRRAAADELRLSEERNRQMVEAVEDHAIYRVDPDGTIASWNEGAQRLKGWTPPEILGRHLSVLYGDGEAAAQRATSLLEGARTTGHVQDEGWVRRRDGTLFWGATSLTRLTDDEGAIRGYTKVTRDLTPQRVARQQLELRTRQLEASNEELDRFAAVASHDLQEPLRMVSSYTELVARRYADRIDPEGRELMGFAVDGARRMKELISDLLEYSRIHTRPESPDLVDLGQVMTGVSADLALAIEETDARIRVHDLPMVIAAPVGMRMLLQNLVGNALKYHGDRPPHIEVTARRRDAATSEVSVRDRGIGIPADRQETVFEPFRRLHPRSEYSGTGIGLAVCRRIVAQHGGRIWIESPEGGGTDVHFTLPVATRLPTGDPHEDA